MFLFYLKVFEEKISIEDYLRNNTVSIDSSNMLRQLLSSQNKSNKKNAEKHSLKNIHKNKTNLDRFHFQITIKT
jgi:hypothetical protein